MKKVIVSLVASIFLVLMLTLSACGGYDTTLFKEKIDNSGVVECNVCLIKKIVDGNSSTYSQGASGVLYYHTDTTYYLLTAFHIVKDLDKDDSLYILLFDEEEYTGGGLSLYYDSLPIGNVEYGDEKYDLAVVSFTSTRELKTINLSSQTPTYKNKIAAIGNPTDHGRNYISFGTITSKEPIPFGDEMDSIQFDVITHSAYVSEGSSGSMLLNEDLELVGINLGGAVNGLGKFIEGKAMPIERIKEFLNDFNSLKKA